MDNGSIEGSASYREEFLTRLWCSHLSLQSIRIDDDFFESGGSSMQVIEMLTTVTERFGRDVDFAEFFKEPCIRRLNELLSN